VLQEYAVGLFSYNLADGGRMYAVASYNKAAVQVQQQQQANQ